MPSWKEIKRLSEISSGKLTISEDASHEQSQLPERCNGPLAALGLERARELASIVTKGPGIRSVMLGACVVFY